MKIYVNSASIQSKKEVDPNSSMLEFNYPHVCEYLEGDPAKDRLNDELTKNWRNIRSIKIFNDFVIISRYNNKSFRSSGVDYEVHELDSSFDKNDSIGKFSSLKDAKNFIVSPTYNREI